MAMNQIIPSLKIIMKALSARVFVMYGLVLFMYFFIFNGPEEMKKAHFKSFNRMIPHYEYLVRLEQGDATVDNEELKEYLFFHERVARYAPEMDDNQTILGYCYYYLGKTHKAIAAFKKAIDSNPVSFWPNYNLGLIYYKTGRFEEATEYFKKALECQPTIAMLILQTSKVFKSAILIAEKLDYDLEDGLRRGYVNCRKMLVLSYWKKKDYPSLLTASLMRLKLTDQDIDFFFYHAGLAAYYLQEYDKANYFLQETIKRDPNHADALEHLGLSYQSQGNELRSAPLLRKAALMKANAMGRVTYDQDIDIQLF